MSQPGNCGDACSDMSPVSTRQDRQDVKQNGNNRDADPQIVKSTGLSLPKNLVVQVGASSEEDNSKNYDGIRTNLLADALAANTNKDVMTVSEETFVIASTDNAPRQLLPNGLPKEQQFDTLHYKRDPMAICELPTCINGEQKSPVPVLQSGELITPSLLSQICPEEPVVKHNVKSGELPVIPPSLDELGNRQQKIEQRSSLLMTRLRFVQALQATKHAKLQISQLVEHSYKKLGHPGKTNGKDARIASAAEVVATELLSRAEDISSMSTSALISLVQKMQVPQLAKASEKSTIALALSTENKKEIDEVTNVSARVLERLHQDLDSDATESSSGGETDDEDTVLTPSMIQTTSVNSIRSEPCWRWVRDRAAITAKWTWLNAQVSDLEYRIRQHGELHRQLRSTKATLLPPPEAAASSEEASMRAARCQPLPISTRKKHKLLTMNSAPSLGSKARRAVTVRCQCIESVRRCAICAGHHNYAQPADMYANCRQERIALVDPSFHPVLSFDRDVDPGMELGTALNCTDKKHTNFSYKKNKQKKAAKLREKEVKKLEKEKKRLTAELAARTKRKKLYKKKRPFQEEFVPGYDDQDEEWSGKPVKKRKTQLKGKLRKKKPGKRAHTSVTVYSDDSYEADTIASAVAPVAGDKENKIATLQKLRRENTYDIDNIVIPYHIAAATRVEKLQYKEIDTPRWRECTGDSTSVHERRLSTSWSNTAPSTPIVGLKGESPIPFESTVPAEPDADTEAAPCVTASGDAPSPSQMVMGDVPALPSTLSTKSSASSLASLEHWEDISDETYLLRHAASEKKEQSRYMNFVTAPTRRPRAHSTIVHGVPKSNGLASPLSPQSQCASPGVGSTSLSASLDEGTHSLKEEMAAARKRSSSFSASKLRKEISLDVPEIAPVQPWITRTFPLVGDDLSALDPDWVPPIPPPKAEHSPEWKVVTAEDSERVVLKLTKRHESA